MKRTTRTSQAGFSLVELMVVVAIIGVLAAIAVPAVNKYIAKARQSEAKTNLASLYTSEKAFYAEYTIFDNRFGAVGYSPEGQLRYNVGFLAAGVTATTANGYNGTLTGAQLNTATKVFCGTGGVISNGCSMLNGATAAVPPDLTVGATTATSFTASARAVIHAAVTGGDAWTMDNNKVLTNTTSGIP